MTSSTEIPARVELATGLAVAQQLETELGHRGLLLAADNLAAAEAETAQLGTRLLAAAIQRCYPISRQEGQALTIEFEGEGVSARLEGALAFGAVTARVLAPGNSDPAGDVELLCAIFNLAVGLVDGLCDEAAETGAALLELLQGQGLPAAAEEPRGRGWLRSTLSTPLAADHTAAFTADVLEAFFEALHAVYPGAASLQRRRSVGGQLEAGLEAERRSVGPAEESTREPLIECSRLTSVIPFRIVETLAGGDDPTGERSPGTLLGEAMWLIDDLVDLCQDARAGALNGVLLAATAEPGRPGFDADIAVAARRAAESLLAGLEPAAGSRANVHGHPPNASFLAFIHRYAGIAPRQPS